MAGALRLARAFLHALDGWFTIVFLFPRMSVPQREARVQLWARKMLRVLGVELQVQGQPPAGGPMMLVCNHLSWLDILVMHAARYCRFVSKSEVRHWPLVGTLATGGGTLYIEREKRRDAMRVVHHMAESLRNGEVVAVFPEGTTGDGAQLLPFHANLIQAAVSAHAPILPMGLRFVTRDGRPSHAPQYLDDDTLLGSAWRVVSAEPFTAVVTFGEPQQANGRGRREWAEALHGEVDRLRRA